MILKIRSHFRPADVKAFHVVGPSDSLSEESAQEWFQVLFIGEKGRRLQKQVW